MQLGFGNNRVLCVPSDMAVIDALAGMVDSRLPGTQHGRATQGLQPLVTYGLYTVYMVRSAAAQHSAVPSLNLAALSCIWCSGALLSLQCLLLCVRARVAAHPASPIHPRHPSLPYLAPHPCPALPCPACSRGRD